MLFGMLYWLPHIYKAAAFAKEILEVFGGYAGILLYRGSHGECMFRLLNCSFSDKERYIATWRYSKIFFPMAKKTSTIPTPKLQLTDAALELIAGRFRALGEPMRLRLLSLILTGERTVGQLVEELASSQANVSKHLGILRQAGMIGTRKEGLSTVCFVSDPIAMQLCELMCNHLREVNERQAKALGSS